MKIEGVTKSVYAELPEMQACADGGKLLLKGMVHTIRDMGEFSFLVLRKRDCVVQCVWDRNSGVDFSAVCEGAAVSITGTKHLEERAPGGFEVIIEEIKVLSAPKEPMPVAINKRKLSVALDAALNLRPVVLRHLQERAGFKIQEGFVRGFRDYLYGQGFTEIHTPKLVAEGAEGGANIFKLDYFGRKAYLAQSPQFYKQMMVGVFERVYEVGPVFRAEKHNTSRHLNEYTGLDFEMGFIEGFEDIMETETGMLKYTFALLEKEYAPQLKLLGVKVPKIDAIPALRFDEAKKRVAEKYNRKIRDPYDLEPEEEQLISRLVLEEYDSEFVFVTHYPSKKRPFYAMDDPADPTYTLSFDLLFRGMEITTGGQRIHDYDEQVAKMVKKGMDPDNFTSYLMIHKYGMPPHGGLGMGLERICMKLLDLSNIREATLFPRDQSRLEP